MTVLRSHFWVDTSERFVGPRQRSAVGPLDAITIMEYNVVSSATVIRIGRVIRVRWVSIVGGRVAVHRRCAWRAFGMEFCLGSICSLASEGSPRFVSGFWSRRCPVFGICALEFNILHSHHASTSIASGTCHLGRGWC